MKFNTQAREKTSFERSKMETVFMNAQILPNNTKEIYRDL